MQKLCKAKTAPPSSSTCTIGGGGVPFYLWNFPKRKQVNTGSLIVISEKAKGALHSWMGGCYAVY